VVSRPLDPGVTSDADVRYVEGVTKARRAKSHSSSGARPAVADGRGKIFCAAPGISGGTSSHLPWRKRRLAFPISGPMILRALRPLMSKVRIWLSPALMSLVACLAVSAAKADGCPTTAADIATDRPDVANSSMVVPAGSLQ